MSEIPFVLATSAVWTHPIIVGLVIGAPTAVLGFMAYRRAEAGDKAAAQAALTVAKGDEIQRAFDAFDRIVDNLQVDNKEVRQLAADLRRRLSECNAAYDDLKRMAGGGKPPS